MRKRPDATLKDFYAILSEVQHYSLMEDKPRHYAYLLDKLERLVTKLNSNPYVDEHLYAQAKELITKW